MCSIHFLYPAAWPPAHGKHTSAMEGFWLAAWWHTSHAPSLRDIASWSTPAHSGPGNSWLANLSRSEARHVVPPRGTNLVEDKDVGFA